MKPYLDLMHRILDNGARKSDRTGTGTLSLFGEQLRFDLSQGFPLVTTKRDSPALGRLRAAVVSQGRYQCRVAARSGSHDLGRVGR